MQLYSPIAGTDIVSESYRKINDNLQTVLTQSAGIAFPIEHLYVGRPCYRTDTQKLYVCRDAVTPIWELIWDFSTNSAPLSELSKKWATARTLTLTGDASGSTSIDGSANIAISVTVADDSHNHVIDNVDGLQTALDGKSATGHGHTISDVSGLGTAAGANVTASATDTTAGRLLKVGDFGLGVSVPPQLPVSDLNNLLLAGCWNVSGNTPNWPFGGEGGAVQQFMHGANTYIVQMAYASTSNRILTRAKTSPTTWTPWREIYHTGNFDPATKVNTTGDESISGTKTFTTALAVTGTGKAAGRLYAGTTDPTNTARLNYDGHLHAKAFGAGRFQMEYNPDTESLDFNFV